MYIMGFLTDLIDSPIGIVVRELLTNFHNTSAEVQNNLPLTDNTPPQISDLVDDEEDDIEDNRYTAEEIVEAYVETFYD